MNVPILQLTSAQTYGGRWIYDSDLWVVYFLQSIDPFWHLQFASSFAEYLVLFSVFVGVGSFPDMVFLLAQLFSCIFAHLELRDVSGSHFGRGFASCSGLFVIVRS